VHRSSCIAIISAGNGNTYGHPKKEALDRMRDAGIVKAYWTERGKGATPKKGEDIVVPGHEGNNYDMGSLPSLFRF